MWRNRIIYLTFLIFTGFFVSFYGGNISYMLFYLAVFTPVFCLIYTLYVNFRFKIHQTIDRVKIIKREAVPYHFILANEDIFTFSSIKVSFFDDKSHIQQKESAESHCLPPKSNKKMAGTIYGDYRGTYEVGAKSVEIADFLNLFTITYPIRSKLKMIVSPRIISVEKMKVASFIMDPGRTKPNLRPLNETVDTELKKYVKGDNRKLIHWKASAKKQELLTKKITDIEELETFLLIDLNKISENEEISIVLEDKIIELALAITNYFLHGKVPIRVIYEDGHINNQPIHNAKEFDFFYNQCVELRFHGEIKIHQLLTGINEKFPDHNYYLVITPTLNEEVFDKLFKMGQNGMQITFFYIRTNQEDNKNMLDALRDIGIRTYDIWMDDDLEELFGVNI